MLVRALNVLDFPELKAVGTVIATAALDQPGDEGWAYCRESRDWQRISRMLRRGARISASGP
jgi:hypothetical protein